MEFFFVFNVMNLNHWFYFFDFVLDLISGFWIGGCAQ